MNPEKPRLMARHVDWHRARRDAEKKALLHDKLSSSDPQTTDPVIQMPDGRILMQLATGQIRRADQKLGKAARKAWKRECQRNRHQLCMTQNQP